METLLITITLLSVGVAIASSVLSWRIRRQDRLRSDARIAALAGEIANDDAADGPLPAAAANPTVDQPAAASQFPIREQSVAIHDGLFSAPRSERPGGRLAAVVAAGALAVATIIGGLVLSSGGE